MKLPSTLLLPLVLPPDGDPFFVRLKIPDRAIFNYSPPPRTGPKAVETVKRPKTQSRNSLCKCGSGKKFKMCCLNR